MKPSVLNSFPLFLGKLGERRESVLHACKFWQLTLVSSCMEKTRTANRAGGNSSLKGFSCRLEGCKVLFDRRE